MGGLKLQHCLIYLHDMIFSDTFENRITRLDDAFQLKASKCEYICEEVTYLGHIFSENGIKTEWQKIKELRDWPVIPIQCMESPLSHLQRSYKRSKLTFQLSAIDIFKNNFK